MIKGCVKDDKVQLQGAKFGSFQGACGVVTNDYLHDFRVKVGEMEIVISNPAVDVQAQPVDKSTVVSLMSQLAELLPNRSELKVKEGKSGIQLQPRDFLRTFTTFEREDYSSSFYVTAQISDVTFSAFVPHLLMAEYDETAAVQPAPQAAEDVAPVEEFASVE